MLPNIWYLQLDVIILWKLKQMIMGLITKKEDNAVRENAEYTGQIHAYKGLIYVEIMKNANSEWFKSHGLDDFYHTIMDKTFGSTWRSAPREKDWIKAHEWLNEQFDMIEKYSTVMISRPLCLNDLNE